MSTRAAEAGLSTALTPAEFEDLIRNLDRVDDDSRETIGTILDRDRDSFLSASAVILSRDTESRASQHLVAILLASGLLAPALSAPSISLEAMVAVLRAALRINPNADVTLARSLAEIALDPLHRADFSQHVRMIEALMAVSTIGRIFPSLGRLMRHPDARFRSKVVLLIGQNNRNPRWVRQRLLDADPRIRANAAEALWGVETTEALLVLRSLMRDSNNRVAGNALLGLYRAGDCTSIAEVVGLAQHRSATFRATAAWVMGETADPRFAEVLAVLIGDADPMVRKRAFAALGAIRNSAPPAQNAGAWRLSARVLENDPRKQGRRVLIALVGPEGVAGPPLRATQIALSEDRQPVLQYKVVERPASESVPVVFVLHRSAASLARACLPWKRPASLWQVLYYDQPESHHVHGASRMLIDAWEADQPAVPAPEASSPFRSSAEELRASLDRVPPAEECKPFWDTVARALRGEGTMPGKRNIVIATGQPVLSPPPEALLTRIASTQSFVQALTPAPDPVMKDFCRRTGGLIRVFAEDSAIDAYVILSGQYEVWCQPLNPDARGLKVRIHTPTIRAETQIDLSSSDSSGT